MWPVRWSFRRWGMAGRAGKWWDRPALVPDPKGVYEAGARLVSALSAPHLRNMVPRLERSRAFLSALAA